MDDTTLGGSAALRRPRPPLADLYITHLGADAWEGQVSSAQSAAEDEQSSNLAQSVGKKEAKVQPPDLQKQKPSACMELRYLRSIKAFLVFFSYCG